MRFVFARYIYIYRYILTFIAETGPHLPTTNLSTYLPTYLSVYLHPTRDVVLARSLAAHFHAKRVTAHAGVIEIDR